MPPARPPLSDNGPDDAPPVPSPAAEPRARLDVLERENRALEHVFDATGIPMLFLDRDLRIVRFTSHLAGLFPIDEADLGQPAGPALLRGGYAEFAGDAEKALASGETVEREVETAGQRYLLARIVPYSASQPPSNRRPDGVVATFLDITRRRRVEEASLRREARFRRVIEEAPIPVFLHDESGRILQISRAVTELTGYTPDDIPTRQAWTERAYGECKEEAYRLLDRLFGAGERLDSREFRVRTKEGGERVWQFSAAPLDTDAQGHRLAISMAADVTERKRAEADREVRAQQQHVIAELGLYALAETDVQALFDRAVRTVQDTLGTDATKVLELAPEGDVLHLRAGVGWPADLPPSLVVPNDARSLAGYTLTVAHPVIVEDFAAEDRFGRPELLSRSGIESGMAVIIGAPERPFGVLGTHTRRPHAYTEADADFLQAVANVLGSAVERASAQRQLQQANAQLAAANETLELRVEERTASLRESEALLRTLYEVIARPAPSFEAQLDIALAEAARLLDLDVGILSHIEEDTYTITACYAPGTALKPGQTFSAGGTCCALAIAEDRPLAIEHLSASVYRGHPCSLVQPVESYLGVPVRTDGTLYGTLNFSSPEPRTQPFPEGAFEFVTLLAQWIGVALARARTDRQLEHSEHLLAGVLLGSVDGIAALRAVRDEQGSLEDFRWLLVNPSAAEILGHPAEALIGSSFLELFPAARSVGLFDAYVEAIEHSEPVQREVFYDADGVSGWFALSVVPLGDGVATTFRDITERKRTEQALRESEARFRELFENSPDAIFVEDLGGTVLDVNPAACRLHRADRAWLLGRPVGELVPPAYRERLSEDFARLARGQASTLESYSLTRDGAVVPVEVRADRVSYGGREAVLLHVRDITARRAAERALKESEERFAKAFHAAPVAVFIATFDEARLVDVNERFCQLSGYARDEVLGRTTRSLGLVASETGPLPGLARLRTAESVRDVELQIRTRTGQLRDVLLSAERIDLGGAPCVLGIGFDVTERKRLEREVIRATEMERRRIGQDLHDELGQQLTGAAFLSKVLQQKLEGQRLPEAEEAAQITELITAALAETRDFSRLLSPVDIQAEGLMDALQDLADQTERIFEVSCLLDTEGDVRVTDNAVATHLFRIAQEAVNNALKHAAPSAVVLHLTRGHRGLRMTIEDDGSGFDPRRARAHGGLGLRTMQYRAALIEAHLSIERGMRGTRVTVRLPPGS